MNIIFKPMFWPSIFSFFVFVMLLSFGTWQVKRLYWKEALIERYLEQSQSNPIVNPLDLKINNINEFSISKIKLFFQFRRIICHVPNPIKTRIKKIIKTENKNLCFKDQINFPKYILQQTKITKQRQQNASTMQLLQNQNDGLW